jgi:hypothetical protein
VISIARFVVRETSTDKEKRYAFKVNYPINGVTRQLAATANEDEAPRWIKPLASRNRAAESISVYFMASSAENDVN